MPSGKKLRRMCVVAITGSLVAACGGEEDVDGNASATDSVASGVPTTTVPLTTDTGAAAGVTPAPGATVTPAPGATPPAGTAAAPAPKAAPAAGGGGNAQAGQVVFSGAGICFSCHGPGGVGTPLAPNLTDNVWLNVPANPTVDQLATVIRNGVPTPRQHPAPMPPMGGASLNDTQIRDVAAYVKSISGG